VDDVSRGGRTTRSCAPCWNLIKSSLIPSILPEFYSWTDRGGRYNVISELGGIEFEPQPHINSDTRNFCLQKSIRWSSRSVDQWTPHTQVERRVLAGTR
jgi:hypothetical protein